MTMQGEVIKYNELRAVKHNSWIQAFRYQEDDEAKGFITSFSNDR